MKTKTPQTPQQIIKNSILGLILVAIAAIIGCSNTMLRPVMLLCIPVAVIHIVRLVRATRSIGTEKKVSQEKAVQRLFYDKCLEFKLTSVSTPAEVQKAETIAESVGVPADAMKDIAAYFNEMKAELEREQQQTRLDAENAQRESEKALHAELTRFAGYQGKEKRIAMLEAERIHYMQEYARYRKAYDTGITIGQEKEIDWATRGGIISGIAGGAAGVSAAVDAQLKNAEIRARNQQNFKAMAPALSEMLSRAVRADKYAKIDTKYIEQTKTKIVSKVPAEQLMKNLTFTEPEITVSTTGAIHLKLNIGCKETPMILDTVKGTIDGTVIAQIYEGNRLVGEADLVFPLWGIATSARTVEGICLSGGKAGAKYRVEYKPRHLWEIEGQQTIFDAD